jgi:hypothetical protein
MYSVPDLLRRSADCQALRSAKKICKKKKRCAHGSVVLTRHGLVINRFPGALSSVARHYLPFTGGLYVWRYRRQQYLARTGAISCRNGIHVVTASCSIKGIRYCRLSNCKRAGVRRYQESFASRRRGVGNPFPHREFPPMGLRSESIRARILLMVGGC